MFDYADKADGAALPNVVLSTAEDEGWGYDDVEMVKVWQDTRSCRYLLHKLRNL